MTNAQPEDITARLDSIEEQLEQLGDEIDLIRTIQNGNRRETRANSQTTARLERTVTQLADTVRIASLRAERDRQEVAQDRQLAAIDRQTFQTEIQRIWEFLRDRGGRQQSTKLVALSLSA